MKAEFTLVLSLVSLGVFGQKPTADKKIAELEAFKKYEIIKIDNQEDLKALSDSTIEITEMVNYMRKNRNDQSGKVTENSKTKRGEMHRTYYFSESGLFAIIERITTKDNSTKVLTYYFGGGQLTNVFDGDKNDVTSSINKQQLYDWIRKMFDEQAIEK